MQRAWERYWFGPGGARSLAAIRIAVGVSVAWSLWRLSEGYAGAPESAPHALYRGVGLLRLYPGEPAPIVIELAWLVACVSTIAMIAGYRTRAAVAASAASGLVIASYSVAFTATWSHEFNPAFLAQLALLGGHAGDAWSVDAWLRRRRGEPPPTTHAYQWSIRLAQLAIAFVFVSAGFSKLLAGHGLGWALSDNLRHQILVRFDLIGRPRTVVGDWLVASELRWKATALLNLVAQCAPLVAIVAMRRPWLRAVIGGLVVTEIIGLGVVMDFWNLHWLPLAAVFVDWDRLWPTREPAPSAPPRVGRAARIFVVAFVVYDVTVAMVHPLIDQKLNTYPFSAFPMFTEVRAKEPHGEHQTYELLGARIEVESEPPLGPASQAWLDGHHTYRMLYRVRSPDVLRNQLGAIRDLVRTHDPHVTIRAVRVHLQSVQAPAYPAPARLDRVDIGVLGELTAAGDFRTLLGGLARADGRWTVTAPADARLAYHLDAGPRAVPLAATRAGDRWLVDLPARGTVHVIAAIGDRTFLVGQRSRRGW